MDATGRIKLEAVGTAVPHCLAYIVRRVLPVCLLLLACGAAAGQSERRAASFVGNSLTATQEPLRYPFLREADVVWQHDLWKAIDLRERFNQYIYFPLDDNDRSGKLSLAYVLWNALVAGDIPIYEDDELLVPIDNEFFVAQYTRADTILLEIGYDDDDNEMYQTVVKPKFFDGAEVQRYELREAWFIGREDARLDSRRLALAPVKEVYMTLKSSGEELFMGVAPMFWVPMQNPSVRRLLAQHTAYFDEHNLAMQPSWDYVFIAQLYSAYVIRESNLFNRTVSSYATGTDAIIEASAIEQKVFEVGDDMWEY